MATPAKKRDNMNKSKKGKKHDESGGDSDDQMDVCDDAQGEKIMVDFMGRSPEDSDLAGIKILLQQLFLNSTVDLRALAEHIISRNYVGSVVKQALDDVEEEDDDEDSDVNDVFGITSVVNISKGQNEECVQQLRELLKELSTKYAPKTVLGTIENILENDKTALGLIINERFVNIPTDISVPLLENLIADMKRATSKKMAYKFEYYILISKLYKPENKEKIMTKKGKAVEAPQIIWSNQEDEAFDENALCTFEFPVDKDIKRSVGGSWAADDDEMIPWRRVMIFEASKLQPTIEKIKEYIAN